MKKLYSAVILYLFVPIIIPILTGLLFPRPLTAGESLFDFKKDKDDSILITSLNVSTNKVSTVPLETYLTGVLAAEMPASYEIEALKAQAVAARSYILSKIGKENATHPDAVICTDSTHCKAWISEEDAKAKWKSSEQKENWEKLESAVNSTKGEYMTYDHQVIEAFFFSSSGGKTENSEDVWGGSRPYLKSVESYGDSISPDNTSTVTLSYTQFSEKLKPYLDNTADTASPISIGEITRTEGGSVATICIGGKTFKGTEIRSIFGLKSANFTIAASPSNVTFTVKGYGHGVGMSQKGANYMAQSGKNYEEILSHYYTDIQITSL